MKSLFVLIVLILFSTTVMAQVDTTSLYSMNGEIKIRQVEVQYTNFIFTSPTGKILKLNYSSDTLKCSGDLELDSAATLFIGYVIEKYSAKMDSLKREIRKLQARNK